MSPTSDGTLTRQAQTVISFKFLEKIGQLAFEANFIGLLTKNTIKGNFILFSMETNSQHNQPANLILFC